MKQFRYLFSSFVLTLTLAATCAAQSNESPCDQIERALSSKASSWKVARKSRGPCQNLSYFKLEFGKAAVYIFIFPARSVEEGENIVAYRDKGEWYFQPMVVTPISWEPLLKPR